MVDRELAEAIIVLVTIGIGGMVLLWAIFLWVVFENVLKGVARLLGAFFAMGDD